MLSGFVFSRAFQLQPHTAYARDLLNSPAGEIGRFYEYIAAIDPPDFPVMVLDMLDRPGRWGDQREFITLGIPAIRVMESQEDPALLDSLRDTWSAIDYSYHQKIVQLNIAFLANAAGGPLPRFACCRFDRLYALPKTAASSAMRMNMPFCTWRK